MKLTYKTPMLLIIGLAFLASPIYAQRQFKALLFTKTEGFYHESINEGVVALKKMAERNFFTVDVHEDPSKFNDKNLEQYQVCHRDRRAETMKLFGGSCEGKYQD